MLPLLTNAIRLVSMILQTSEVDTSMIGQTEMPDSATRSNTVQPPFCEQSRPWPPHDEESIASEELGSLDARQISSARQMSEIRKSKSSCGSFMYALSFVIPATTVSAIYLPDAIQSGNCALATIPAVLAGSTAFGLYRLCKFIKHRKVG